MKYLALTIRGPDGQLMPIQAPKGVPDGGLATTGQSITSTVVTLLLYVSILMTLFYLIYGGFKWMTSQGDQEKIASARSTILYAFIGLGVVALAFVIINAFDVLFHPDQCLLCLFSAGT